VSWTATAAGELNKFEATGMQGVTKRILRHWCKGPKKCQAAVDHLNREAMKLNPNLPGPINDMNNVATAAGGHAEPHPSVK